MKEKESGIIPITNDPCVEISEIIGPNAINISIDVLDFPRFLKKVSSLKGNSSTSFIKEGERPITVKIKNVNGRRTIIL